ETIRENATLTKSALRTLLESAPTAAVRARLDRLTAVAGKSSVWSEDEEKQKELPKRLGMKPAESALYRLLIDDDLLWVGQSALRVAARLHDSDSDRTNRLSDGRVHLVKLVGAGEKAPLRMAALRLIGSTLCNAKNPLCDPCPLSSYCEGRESAAGDLVTEALSGTHGRQPAPAQSRE